MKTPFLIVASLPVMLAASTSLQRQALAAAAPYIDKANQDWTRAILTGDATVLSAPYASNGIFIGPDGTEVRGKEAVRAMYAKPRSVKVLKARIRSDGRAAHGPDDVYEWGTAVMTVRSGDKVKEASGRYLTVWHRYGASWRISHNIAF